jgi:hypothetical protein
MPGRIFWPQRAAWPVNGMILPTFSVLIADTGWAAGAAQAVVAISAMTRIREAIAKYLFNIDFSCLIYFLLEQQFKIIAGIFFYCIIFNVELFVITIII